MTQVLMTGQVAMITGAGSGIGRAAALKFAVAGARVVLGEVTGAEEDAVEMVRVAGGQAASLRMDAGNRANAGSVAYSASKAGVMNLVQTAAQDLRGTGIRVNAICAGVVETGMTKLYYDFSRATGNEQRLGHTNPLEGGGQPEEIADVALFLSSPIKSYVNGQALAVGGGLSSGHPTAPRIDLQLVEQVLAAKRAETAG